MRLHLLSSLSLATLIHACAREFNQPAKHTHRKRMVKRQADFPPVLSEQEALLVNSFDNNTIDQWSYYYTHKDKLAGLGKEAAQWTADKWSEYGFESHLAEYQVYLSHPVSASLHVNFPNGTTEEVSLVEDKLPEDDVTSWENNQPTFHGFSASGDVTAEYVYVG
jgi:N-acetylated-alpha-linked acidic dipeptidase